MEHDCSLPHSQEPATYPDSKTNQSIPCPHLKIHFHIILPSTLESSKWFFPRGFPPKSCMQLSSPLCVLRVPPLSFLSIWSPEQYLVSCIDQ